MYPRAITLRYPFNGTHPVASHFGEIPVENTLKQKYKEWGIKGHHGIDFKLPLGTKVVATDSGNVVQAGNNNDFGISVTLEHGWGMSFYAHLKETHVSLDQQIKTGQIIGLSGQSGFTTGAHLHFGIKPLKPDLNNGYLGFIDPTPFFVVDSQEKLIQLKEKLTYYEGKLAFRMKRYRGVIHESGVSEMKHNEVMVLRAIVAGLKREIALLTN